MNYLGQAPEDVEREAQALVREHMSGSGKNRAAAKKILLSQVSKRYDARSKAIQRILERAR